VCADDVIEREDPVDYGFESPSLNMVRDLEQLGSGSHRRAQDGQVLEEEASEREGDVGAARGAARNERATRAEQSNGSLEDGFAYVIEHDVDATFPSELEEATTPLRLLLVVDGLLDSHGFGTRALLGGPGGREDPRSVQLRDLDRGA